MASPMHTIRPISVSGRSTRARFIRCRLNREAFHHPTISVNPSRHHMSTLILKQRHEASTQLKRLRGPYPPRRLTPSPCPPDCISPSISKRGLTSSTALLQNGAPQRSQEFMQKMIKEQMQQGQRGDQQLSQMNKIKDATKGGKIHRVLRYDLGVIPGTVVFPNAVNRPPLFSKQMLKLLRLMLRYKFVSWISRLAYKYQTIRNPRPKIESNRQLVSIAKDLYERMNAAFARGDKAVIRKICCGGLEAQLISNIDGRQRQNSLAWKLMRYTGRSKVASHRSTYIPHDFTQPTRITDDKPQRSAIRQVIVRLSSLQALGENTSAEAPEKNPSVKESEVTEYVVIQKYMSRGKEGEWKIWGTVKNMTVDEIDEATSEVRRGQSMESTLEQAGFS